MCEIGEKGGKPITSAKITPNDDGTFSVFGKNNENNWVLYESFDSLEKANLLCKEQQYTFILVENKKRD